MENKILILPDNAEQIVVLYLPEGENSSLIRELRMLEFYLQNRLPPRDPQRWKLSQLSHAEILGRMKKLRIELFRLSLSTFITQACEKQREMCLINFYAAPCGEEAEWISDSRMPDIYLVGEYERLNCWWNGLASDRQQQICKENTVLGTQEDEDIVDENNDPEYFWSAVSLEKKRELFQRYSLIPSSAQ